LKSLPEVGISAEALLGAQLLVGRPDLLGTDEDDQALAHVFAAHRLIAEDGVGHEPLHGRDELFANLDHVRAAESARVMGTRFEARLPSG
jgi:hypothetical protein